MSNVIRGTIKELIEKRVKVNGHELGQAELSVLTRLGRGTFAIEEGVAPRPAGTKGKPASIWKLDSSAALNVTVGE